MLIRQESHSLVGSRSGWPRVGLRFLGELAQLIFGPSEANTQRQDVIRRALVASAIIAVLPIQQMRIPGWPAVLAACATALAYNVPLAYLVYIKDRVFLQRVLGVVLDMIVLMGGSFYVLREMGSANSASDLWLVFVVYIVIGGFTLAPVGSLLYTALWTSWFALATLLYFPASSQYQDELPIRLIFLGLIGIVSLGMARELQKRRERLEQQNRQTIGMLATLVEARDTDAGKHLHRIQHFSRALALHVGSSQREAQEIANASMVHDVGKANVPDAILKKTGPLTVEERRIMQDHTSWGDRILTENSEFEMARFVARWHHERWDGTGYPDGLEGEQIPLEARIVAVADVYDALISKRPYKEAWPAAKAIGELQTIADRHLDKYLVDAFVQLWENGVIDRIAETLVETADPAPMDRVA